MLGWRWSCPCRNTVRCDSSSRTSPGPMRPASSSSARQRREVTMRRSLFRSGAVLAFGVVLGGPPALAAHLPDWAAAIAAGAPAVPQGSPPTLTRILLSETRYAVQPDGTYRIRRRLAVQ